MKVFGNGCRVIYPDEGEVFIEGTRAYRCPISRDTGAVQIAQRISLYATGLAPARVNPNGEEVHFVVSGDGTVSIDSLRYTIEAGTAFYTPAGAVFAIQNSAEQPLKIVSVACPEDDEARTVEGMQPSTGFVVGQPSRSIHEGDVSTSKSGDRQFKVLLEKSFGCERVTQFIGFIPKGRAPQHHHSYEEAIHILEGRGVIWAGDENCNFGPGTSIYLPIEGRHSLENTASEPVKLLGVFYPSGSPAVSYS